MGVLWSVKTRLSIYMHDIERKEAVKLQLYHRAISMVHLHDCISFCGIMTAVSLVTTDCKYG